MAAKNSANGLRTDLKGILALAICALCGTTAAGAAVNRRPETPEEIEAYKQHLIKTQRRRMGHRERRDPVRISSLQELSEYSGKSGLHVKMEPGTYEVTLDNFTDFLGVTTVPRFKDHSISPIIEQKTPYLFNFSGMHSLFDLRGVTIKIDTRILHRYAEPLGIDGKKYGIEEVLVTGDNLIIRGLTVEDVHEIRPDRPKPDVTITEVKASGRPHKGAFSFDGNPGTNWSAQGKSEWIEYRLSQSIPLSEVSLQTRDGRRLPFEIQVPRGDGWQTIYEGETDTDGEMETYRFDRVKTDRVRILGHGDQRNWNNVYEARIGDLPWPNAYPRSTRHHPSRTARTFHVAGRNNLFRNVSITSRGSRPYGYGRLLGKGAHTLAPMNKHTAVAAGGDKNVYLGFEVYPRSYGHALGWGENETQTFIDCHVEGVIRSTDAMLKETSGPAYEADFKNFWTEKKIKPGMMVSLHEDTFRAYPHTALKGNVPGTVKILGCTVAKTSSGTALAGAYEGDVFVSNTTAIRNTQRGFAVPSGAKVVNCRSDIRYGPALDLRRGSNNTDIDITILPSPNDVERQRFGNRKPIKKLAAIITGSGHEITLTAQGDLELDEPIPIVIGNSQLSNRGARNVFLKNTTGLPIILTEKTRNCRIITNGEIIKNEGENNTIKRLSK